MKLSVTLAAVLFMVPPSFGDDAAPPAARHSLLPTVSFPWPSLAGAATPPIRRVSTTVEYFQIGRRSTPEPPLVRVRLGFGYAANMVVDTGFPCSVISDRVAVNPAPESSPDDHTHGQADSAQTATDAEVTLPMVQIGAIHVPNLHFTVVNHERLYRMFEAPIDGILGDDFLQRVAIAIDGPRHRMTVWYPGALSAEGAKQAGFDSGDRAPLDDPDDPFCVHVGLPDQSTAALEVDTGSDSTSLPWPTVQALHLKVTSGSTEHATFFGTRTEQGAFLPSLSLGNVTIRGLRVGFKKNDNSDFTHLLGMDFLGRCRMLFDFAENQMFIRMGDPDVEQGLPSNQHVYTVLLPQSGGRYLPGIMTILDDQRAHDFGFSLDEPQTLIDRAAARRAGLPISHQRVDGQDIELATTYLRAGGFGRVRIRMRVVQPFWRQGVYKIFDGLIGRDLLSHIPIKIDLGDGVLEFVAPFRPIPSTMRPGNWSRVPLLPSDAGCAVVGSVDGHPVRFLPSLTGDNTVLRDRRLLARLRPTGSLRIRGARDRILRLQQLSLGSVRWTDPVCIAGPAHGDEDVNLLSLDFLRRSELVVDLPERALYLTRDPSYHDDPLEWVSTGVQLLREPSGEWRIASILAPSPASAAGLRKGDRVIAIDGEAVTGTDYAWLAAQRTRDLGKPITFTVRRGDSGKVLTYRLTARKLL